MNRAPDFAPLDLETLARHVEDDKHVAVLDGACSRTLLHRCDHLFRDGVATVFGIRWERRNPMPSASRPGALAHGWRACSLETTYRTAVVWRPFADALEAAVLAGAPSSE
jgi:hypothetical protein